MKGTKESNTGTQNINLTLVGNTVPTTSPKGKTLRTALANIFTGGNQGGTIHRSIGGYEVDISVKEIGGQETQATKLNPNNYTNTDAFILTFGYNSRSSFDQIKTWYDEAKRSAPQANVVLVGIKETSKSSGKDAVSTQDAQQLARELHINSFAECSLDNPQSVQKVFETTITSTMGSNG